MAEQTRCEQVGVCTLEPELMHSCVRSMCVCSCHVVCSRSYGPRRKTLLNCRLPCSKYFLMVVAVEIIKFPRKSLKIPGSPVKQQVSPGKVFRLPGKGWGPGGSARGCLSLRY